MKLARYIAVTSISSINLILHIISCYVHLCLYWNGQQSVQFILLVNLTVAELVFNMISVPYAVVGSVAYSSDVLSLIHSHLTVEFFQLTGTYILYFLSMIHILIDRLLVLLSNNHYNKICTKARTAKVLILPWILFLIVKISLPVVCKFVGTKKMIQFVFPTIVILILSLNSVFILTMLFYAVVLCSQRLVPVGQSSHQDNSRSCTFTKTKHYIPTLLITSFTIFTAIPGLILTVFIVKSGYDAEAMDLYITVSVNISFTMDAIIIIFIQENVRKFVFKKLSFFKKRFNMHCYQKRQNNRRKVLHERTIYLPHTIKPQTVVKYIGQDPLPVIM